jgi:two-component system OmpR family response regulator
MGRILIVTDDPWAEQLTRLRLEDSGHEVESATDAAAALKRAVAFRPMVALIDADLGRGRTDGDEVARQLRGALGAEVFLVLHTGYALLEPIRAGAQRAGFDAYLGKPARSDELLALVEKRGGSGGLWDPPAQRRRRRRR